LWYWTVGGWPIGIRSPPPVCVSPCSPWAPSSFVLLLAAAMKGRLPVAFRDRWRATRQVTRQVTTNHMIVVATTVYAIRSLVMWMELKNSNEGAQRAWVVVQTDDVRGLLAAPRATFAVKIENAGKSPLSR